MTYYASSVRTARKICGFLALSYRTLFVVYTSSKSCSTFGTFRFQRRDLRRTAVISYLCSVGRDCERSLIGRFTD